jgi:hypothetical protein
MRMLKILATNTNVLNVLLLGFITAALWLTLFPFSSAKVAHTVAPPQESAAAPAQETTAPQIPSLSEFMEVADRNLFHPERRVPEKKEQKELPRPDLVLYGTLMDGGLSYAYVEDKKSPHSTPGRGKRQLVLKKGDSVGGFILKEIQANQILLVRGDESMRVYLDDGKKVRGEETTRAGGTTGLTAPGSAPVAPRAATGGTPSAAATATTQGTIVPQSPSGPPPQAARSRRPMIR